MLPLVLTLLTACHDRDAGRLGADDWHMREAAHAHLEVAGWRAWPSLLRAEYSPDAEVRRRAADLLDGPRQDARAAAVRGLVLWLVYAPLPPETWEALEWYGPEQRWVHRAVFDYAEERGLLAPHERQRYHQGWAWFWPGEAFCHRLWLIRVRTGAERLVFWLP